MTTPMRITMQDGTTHQIVITPFSQMKAEEKAQKEHWDGGFQSLRATMYAAYWTLRHHNQTAVGFDQWAADVTEISADATDEGEAPKA